MMPYLRRRGRDSLPTVKDTLVYDSVHVVYTRKAKHPSSV